LGYFEIVAGDRWARNTIRLWQPSVNAILQLWAFDTLTDLQPVLTMTFIERLYTMTSCNMVSVRDFHENCYIIILFIAVVTTIGAYAIGYSVEPPNHTATLGKNGSWPQRSLTHVQT